MNSNVTKTRSIRERSRSVLLSFSLCLCAFVVFLGYFCFGQEQIDKLTTDQRASPALSKTAMRIRVSNTSPKANIVRVNWSSGGHGLGGENIKGFFTANDKSPDITAGNWSAWLPLNQIVGRTRDWEFPNIFVQPSANGGKKRDAKKFGIGFTNVVVDFEFAENGRIFKTFTETAPNGATVSFAFPSATLNDKGAADLNFVSRLQSLSAYARSRREHLEIFFSKPAKLPNKFAVLGHLGGYGEGADYGKGGGSGYGVRHSNPEILKDECRSLRLLGVNGLVGSIHLAEKAGFSNEFRRIYWGGPGSGSPLQHAKRKKGDICPFDPDIRTSMSNRVAEALAEHRAANAKESWALWDDEIGVYVKEHMQSCPRCAAEFRNYLRGQNLKPTEFGRNSWDEVLPYKIFGPNKSVTNRPGKTKEGALVDPPTDQHDALNFYYTFRFMTYATAKIFPEAAQQFKTAGIPLYAMQGPTPSWSGSSLDWHEFYDLGANTAIVFETSNRDPQVWQMESYLADIARGIAARHQMPFGCLVKPHRGAPEQRMLSVVSRGCRAIEWYTYGPDYAKADSFSQRPELLEAVGRADRFLGQAEEYLYGAHLARPAEVAFVSPRSSEIWGKATSLGVTAFEDAKWVYLALLHDHIPVDVLSEQQLAEGKLNQYKAIYICGPNLRRDAAANIKEWVRNGGFLWTDALGLTRDEANQPFTEMNEVLGVANRRLETWAEVKPYRAIDLQPFNETNSPSIRAKTVALGQVEFETAAGREHFETSGAKILARFGDNTSAITENKFGKGKAFVFGFWAGLSYSAKVRKPVFHLRDDFDPALASAIGKAAFEAGAAVPVIASERLVETVFLNNNGQRSIALINWDYESRPGERETEHLVPARDVSLNLLHVGSIRSARSLRYGNLAVESMPGADQPNYKMVTVPKVEAIDLIILE